MARERSRWRLGELLEGLAVVPHTLAAIEIGGLSTDSRTLSPGDLFIALSGTTLNGANFVNQAMERGAGAILWETGSISTPVGIQVEDLGPKVGQIASRFYGNPSAHLRIAAVTGTDGKSSVTHFIARAMEKIEGGAGVVGTLGNHLLGREEEEEVAGHTTPPPIALQGILHRMVQQGGRSVAMEASSHGIEQSRLTGCALNTALLTQLGRDHLDYHGSIENYRAAKRALFYTPGLESMVLNLDDSLGREISREPPEGMRRVIGYTLDNRAALSSGPSAVIHGQVVEQNRDGMELLVEYSGSSMVLKSRLYGRFNASNLLATLGLLICWEVPFPGAVKAVETVRAVPGRMESFRSEDGATATLIVDYAHTPGALGAALRATREHLGGSKEGGRLWILFGCGGERDRGKRAEMGAVAEHHADHLVLTNDNPRGEDPDQIIEEILQGIERPERVETIPDREAAIRHCFIGAQPEDTVLIAGKGHEQWQWIGGDKIPFSDRDLAAQLVAGGGSGG